MIKPENYIKIWKGQPQLGVTYNMVRKAHTEQEYAKFIRWMGGQTQGMMDNGEAAVYSWDYERWCRQGKKTVQNAVDWD